MHGEDPTIPDAGAATVNGLPLSAALAEAIRSGRWRVPPDEVRLRKVFPRVEPIHPMFFGLDVIQRENRGWLEETLESWIGREESHGSLGAGAPGEPQSPAR